MVKEFILMNKDIEVLHFTSEIRSDLKNLRDFEFEREAVANLPEERIRVLENIIQTQIKNILDDMR